MPLGLINNNKLSVGSGAVYVPDPITTAWFGGMSNDVPIEVQKIFNNYFVKSSTAGVTVKSIIAKANGMYFPFVNNTADSWRNIVKDAHHGTIEGIGLQFDPYWGWDNPSGTGWVDLHFNPATQGDGKYTLNDNSVFTSIFGNNLYSANQYIITCQQSISIRYVCRINANANSISFGNNANVLVTTSNIPFFNGVIGCRRSISTTHSIINQNIVTTSVSSNSISLPNTNFKLFINDQDVNYPYLGGISFVFIGASLTDAEFTTLNNAVNDTLIQLLLYRYKGTWAAKMAKSYFLELHNFEKYEAWEVYEFIKRMLPDHVDSSGTGYYYNTFGPNGQNKTIADFIMLLKAGGNLISNSWSKTGVLLRWNQDSSITNSNTMPAYTRGTNLGIVTVTSTDGWNGVSTIDIVQTSSSTNSFYGNFPELPKIKKFGVTILNTYQNRIKVIFVNVYNLINKLYSYTISYPGYLKYNLNNTITTSTTSIRTYSNSDASEYTGILTTITNQILTDINIQANSTKRMDSLSGTLQNLVLVDTLTSIQITYSGVTQGTSTWNKNIGVFNLSNCLLTTLAVDNQLSVINTYFSTVTPIKNVTINLSGSTMGIPTGGVDNTDLLEIVNKHAVAGFSATIIVRTS